MEGCLPAPEPGRHGGGIRAARLVDVACRTVLEQLADGVGADLNRVVLDVDAWVIGARQVYTQTCALLNSSGVHDDDANDDDDDDGDDDDRQALPLCLSLASAATSHSPLHTPPVGLMVNNSCTRLLP